MADNTEKNDKTATPRKRKRGEREWTAAQREAAAERMRKLNRSRNAKSGSDKHLSEKTDGIENLTLGLLMTALENLHKSGIKKSTSIEFRASCIENPEVICEKRLNQNGDITDVLIIR